MIEEEEKEVRLYKTLYRWKKQIINLLSEEKAMEAFNSHELTLKGIEI